MNAAAAVASAPEDARDAIAKEPPYLLSLAPMQREREREETDAPPHRLLPSILRGYYLLHPPVCVCVFVSVCERDAWVRQNANSRSAFASLFLSAHAKATGYRLFRFTLAAASLQEKSLSRGEVFSTVTVM